MTIYICGPMTGIEDLNHPAFFKAEEHLKSKGYTVINQPEWTRNWAWTHTVG